MSAPPENIKIYHITHIENLPGMVEAERLYSDAKRIELGIACNLVGMSTIKQRRLEELEVSCCPGTMVGEYVPFYFCPRSVMLFLLYKGNHPDLEYRGGQEPIVHLQADLNATIRWAEENDVGWAFSSGNAGARYASFYSRKAHLNKLDWAGVANSDFRDPMVKEAKQSEFLVFESFPLHLVEKIGVINATMLARTSEVVENGIEVAVESQWYY